MRLPSILRRRGRAPAREPDRAPAPRQPWRRRETSTIHEIGGRRFAELGDSTLEHDLHAWALIRKADLESVLRSPDEDPVEHARKLFEKFVDSESALALLACGLVPEGVPSIGWTPALAAETESFLRKLSDPRDKARVEALLLSMLESFFLRGIVSLWSSPTSSVGADAASPGSTGSGTT
ncbi:MAG TPA: hypothetical protein VJK66_01840 [Gaiellaceae bacterium]|nr:hypothetical protein [Gaiellaceae bacterium]